MPTTHPEIEAPSRLLAMAEWQRAVFEFSLLPFAAPLLAQAPRGDGHAVLVLPGFLAGDMMTTPLREYLSALGYRTHGWGLGRNLGPKVAGPNGRKLTELLASLHEESGGKVSLIGWSLGGIMARELAARRPGSVRQVITLGSPFTGNPKATTIAKLYEKVSGEDLSSEHVQRRARRGARPPPIPSTAIYSRSDGVVAWRNCVEAQAPHTDSIEVFGSHCGLPANPAVLYAVADRLAQGEDEWAPFDRAGCRAAFYPAPEAELKAA